MVTFSFGGLLGERLAFGFAFALAATKHVTAAMMQPTLAADRDDNFMERNDSDRR